MVKDQDFYKFKGGLDKGLGQDSIGYGLCANQHIKLRYQWIYFF